MGIFMVYVIYRSPIYILASIKFGFEVINQKMFEMKIEKMAHLAYFIIFQLKMIVCQNVNLLHTCGHCFEKHQFVI
jgi:hypothetical protein